ncbi:MAG TPA: sensor histidine kinase [Candidatus Nitrosopolaris rasttigaisensis]|nr:sensor histidine kinase [Candidatus Nitrosopolaris rasttigaisensis]
MVAFSKSNILLLLVIAAIGTSLSILSYQYSSVTAKDIAEIASQEIRSNARIEAHDLSELLIHDIQSITNNLRTLAAAPAIHNNMTILTQVLIDSTQASTKVLTDGYYLLDQNGRLIAWSNSNGSSFGKTKSLDLGSLEYFIVPKKTHSPYYTSVMTSADNVPRLYIAFPIMVPEAKFDKGGSIIVTKTFKGVIVAAVNVNSIGNSLQSELSPEIISNVGLMDKNGVFLYARNHALIGKNYLGDEFQSSVPPEIKDSYDGILGRSLQGNSGTEDITVRGNTTTISYQPVTIDGKRLWTLYIGSPHSLTSNVGLLIDQQKNFSTLAVVAIGAIAVGMAFLILSWNRRLKGAVDARTSELRRANESLIESNKLLASANEQLKVHDRMQSEFINVAAHELRTPIMPILGDAEYIEHKFDITNEIVEVDKETIASIIRNAKRLDRLASDILDVTRIESKSLKLNKEQFDLSDVLLTCVQDLREQMEDDDSTGRNVKISYTPRSILVEADKGRITQVILNLLRNAIKFTSEGVISIDAFRKDDKVLVGVKDTGPGIDPEILPRLFSKFVTKSDKGTGLGLFISKSIIDAHRGTIWAENNADGRGCTFTFSIPST